MHSGVIIFAAFRNLLFLGINLEKQTIISLGVCLSGDFGAPALLAYSISYIYNLKSGNSSLNQAPMLSITDLARLNYVTLHILILEQLILFSSSLLLHCNSHI